MSFGYRLAGMSAGYAREARLNEPGPAPLPPDVDPLTAIDPELREMILSPGPIDEPHGAPTAGDRARSALIGGVAIGVLGAAAAGLVSRADFGSSVTGGSRSALFGGVLGALVGASVGAWHAGGKSTLLAPTEIAPASTLPTDPNAPAHPAFAALHAQG